MSGEPPLGGGRSSDNVPNLGVAEYRALRGMKTGGRVGYAAFDAGKMVIAPPS
jgi:hypothetical protein